MAAFAFLRPGPPHAQLLGDLLPTAKSAIFVGVLNGVVAAAPSYLRLCGHGGDVERAYMLASYLTAVLGVALLAAGMAISSAPPSPVWERVLKRAAWAAKVLTAGTLQFGLTVLHSCLGMRGRLALLFGVAMAVIWS